MSDTPRTDREIKAEGEDAFYSGIATIPANSVHVDFARKMERLLRHLRANANCYVPPARLKEIDDFLDQK